MEKSTRSTAEAVNQVREYSVRGPASSFYLCHKLILDVHHLPDSGWSGCTQDTATVLDRLMLYAGNENTFPGIYMLLTQYFCQPCCPCRRGFLPVRGRNHAAHSQSDSAFCLLTLPEKLPHQRNSDTALRSCRLRLQTIPKCAQFSHSTRTMALQIAHHLRR